MGTGPAGWEVSLVMKLFNWSLVLLEMLAVTSGLQGARQLSDFLFLHQFIHLSLFSFVYTFTIT